MTALYQRLKEMSKEDFESLIDQLLQAKYPTVGIMRVEGSGGDEGIDNFQGNLSDGPAIWQDKHFTNRIQKAQRKQILKSIAAAFKSRTPRRWVLCLPINLRTTEHNWFQQSLKTPYERQHPASVIELMQASHLVKDLLHFRTVRETFFPDAVSDITRVKALVMNTDALSTDERGRITAEHAQQYLVSLKELDARCDYEVTIGGEGIPDSRPEPRLLMTFRRGDLLTRVLARDAEAIRLDPISFNLKLQGSAGEKICEAADTGRPQTLSSDEVLGIASESPLFAFAFQDFEKAEIQLVPYVAEPTNVIPLKFVFGRGCDTKEIAYLPFRREYVGLKEVTLRTSGGQAPIDICIKLRLDEGATISFTPRFAGADVCSLQHVLDCIDVLKVSPFLEVLSVEFGRPLFSGDAPFPSAAIMEQRFRDMIADAALVSKHFGVQLILPNKITEQDLFALLELRRVATGELFEAGTLDASLVKIGGSQEHVIMNCSSTAGALVFQPEAEAEPVMLFGALVSIGRPIFKCEKVKLLNPEELGKLYVVAKLGDVVPVKWACVGKCRFISGQTLEEVTAPREEPLMANPVAQE